SKIKAAEVNEGRLKSLIADTLPSLKKDISVEARAYNELPTMHGFLIDDSVLVVGVCDTFDGIIKTTPYMVFVGDQEEQNLDPDIARNMIEIFSSWFDAHWSTGRRINPGTPGVGDAKAVSP
ncbi:hypothetical protein, partial [Caballeronia sp.]|uniref:hypothetical protein n=1 Tax=Caballeronia sp. TaxID=1931223 RepID=UPI003C43E21C